MDKELLKNKIAESEKTEEENRARLDDLTEKMAILLNKKNKTEVKESSDIIEKTEEVLVNSEIEAMEQELKDLEKRKATSEKDKDIPTEITENNFLTPEEMIRIGIKEAYIDEKEEKDIKTVDPELTKTSIEITKTILENARQDFFAAKNEKKPEKKKFVGILNGIFNRNEKYSEDLAKYNKNLEEKEKTYRDYKNEYVKYLISEKENPQEFLLKEVELKRTNDIENGPLSTRIKTGISKGIKYWEEIGNNQNDSKTVRFLKKTGKSLAAIAIIGGASAAAVSAFATIGIGTASAITASYFTRRMAMTTGFSAAMEVIPTSLKPIAGKLMVGLSMTSMAGVAGLMASKASTWATKKWWSEEAITKKTGEKTKKLEINLDTLDADLKKYEEDCEKILKEASKKRTYRRLLAGATALTVGVAFLEVAGHTIDKNGVQTTEDTTKQNVSHQNETVGTIKTPIQENNGVENTQDQNIQNDETKYDEHPESKAVQEFMETSSTQNAIDLGMYNPNAEAESMIAQNGTMTFIDDNGHRIEVLYSPNGAIQTIADLKKEIHDYYGEEVPSGQIETEYTDLKNVEHAQILIKGDDVNQIKNADMFDSNKNVNLNQETIIEEENDGVKYPVEEQVDFNGNPINADNVKYIPEEQVDFNGNPINAENILDNKEINQDQIINKNIEEIKIDQNETNATDTHKVENENTNVDTLNNKELEVKNVETYLVNHNDYLLSDQQLEEVNKVYTDNVSKMFSGHEQDWNSIKYSTTDNSPVELMKSWQARYDAGNVEEIPPYISHLFKISKETDLKPYGVTILSPVPETPEEFELRCLQKAINDPNIGLDKVKFIN